MKLTFGEAKKFLSEWAGRSGKCPDSEDAALFVKEVLQYTLITGMHGNIRKFCFHAQNGCFTAPPELETPLKVKIEGRIGTVWNRWFEWFSQNELSNCFEAADALQEDPNEYSTVYDLPSCGAHVGVLGTCKEADDAHIIVQGVDLTGLAIFTVHNGQQISGEYLRIRKGEIRHTQVKFGKITGIVKTKTNGYVQLLSINPTAKTQTFLSSYSPNDEKPSFRRFNLTSPDCQTPVKVAILGRIRLKDSYADSDIIPFENLYALSLAAQAINANKNNDVEMAAAKDQTMTSLIERENIYKVSKTGQPVEFFQPTSPGTIKNII